MTPERLEELRSQRDLMRRHLDWLDAEITRASAEHPTQPRSAPNPAPYLDVADFTADPAAAGTAARRGCLLGALILVLLVAALLSALYYWRYRDHPALFVPTANAGPVKP